MKQEYKVGDTVILKSFKQIKKEFVCKKHKNGFYVEDFRIYIVDDMLEFLGKEVIIEGLYKSEYLFYSNNRHWAFQFIDADYQDAIFEIKIEIGL
jgi:hypothetical protein